MKNIHKHEEHTPKKLIQIKLSNTIKVQTTDLSKYNPQNPSQNININKPTHIQTHGSISNHASNPIFQTPTTKRNPIPKSNKQRRRKI